MSYPFRLLPTLLCLLVTCHASGQRTQVYSERNTRDDDVARGQALDILQQRCNTCHRNDNPRKVFTGANMEKNAGDIYRQVFLYRRMPKNAPASLTAAEKAILERWLSSNPDVRRLKK